MYVLILMVELTCKVTSIANDLHESTVCGLAIVLAQ